MLILDRGETKQEATVQEAGGQMASTYAESRGCVGKSATLIDARKVKNGDAPAASFQGALSS